MRAHTPAIRPRAFERCRQASAALLLACGVLACDSADSPVEVPRDFGGMHSVNTQDAPMGIPGQYIVTLDRRVIDPARVAGALVKQANGTLRFTYRAALTGFAAKLSDPGVAALRSNPMVVGIEEDRILVAADIQSRPPWALDRVDQRSLPLSASFSYWNAGAGVNLYIIDTGIRTSHKEFAGRAFGAFTAVPDEYGTEDCHGHGTQVAGVAGGTTYGVAKAARLYSVRVMDCAGIGQESAVIAGLDWLAANRQLPAVANMSMGGDYSLALNQAVANTIAAGVTITVAAGNNGLDACQYSPSSTAAAITVGASTALDSRASFSNWGPCLDVFAPGTSVATSAIQSDSAVAYPSGTSMSAPLVAGAAALYLSANPSATPTAVGAALMNSATMNVISSAGVGSPNRLLYVGSLSSSDPSPTPPPMSDPVPVEDEPPTATFTANCPRGRCTFDGSGSTDDKGIISFSWDFGDGLRTSASTSSKTSHSYALPGVYTVTLTVSDGVAQLARSQQLIKVRKI